MYIQLLTNIPSGRTAFRRSCDRRKLRPQTVASAAVSSPVGGQALVVSEAAAASAPAPSTSKVPSPARISGRQQQTTSGKDKDKSRPVSVSEGAKKGPNACPILCWTNKRGERLILHRLSTCCAGSTSHLVYLSSRVDGVGLCKT